MSKKGKKGKIIINGISYYADRPQYCSSCFFWSHHRPRGCVLGMENCYYLAEAVKTEQELKCENCCYAKGEPCVSVVCYKDLEKWRLARQAKRRESAGDENG